jgi:hypothetical protein
LPLMDSQMRSGEKEHSWLWSDYWK